MFQLSGFYCSVEGSRAYPKGSYGRWTKSCMTLRTLNYGNYGIFLIMGHAGFCPSAVCTVVGDTPLSDNSNSKYMETLHSTMSVHRTPWVYRFKV